VVGGRRRVLRAGGPDDPVRGGLEATMKLTPKERKIVEMMIEVPEWPRAAAFVFDTTTAAKNCAHAMVRKGFFYPWELGQGYRLTAKAREAFKT